MSTRNSSSSSSNQATKQRDLVRRELDALRQQKLASRFHEHFSDLIQTIEAEKAEADAALRDLEARRLQHKDHGDNSHSMTAWDVLHAEWQQKKEECKRKERETRLLYQRYVDRFAKETNNDDDNDGQQQDDIPLPPFHDNREDDLEHPRPLTEYPPAIVTPDRNHQVTRDAVPRLASEFEQEQTEEPVITGEFKGWTKSPAESDSITPQRGNIASYKPRDDSACQVVPPSTSPVQAKKPELDEASVIVLAAPNCPYTHKPEPDEASIGIAAPPQLFHLDDDEDDEVTTITTVSNPLEFAQSSVKEDPPLVLESQKEEKSKTEVVVDAKRKKPSRSKKSHHETTLLCKSSSNSLDSSSCLAVCVLIAKKLLLMDDSPKPPSPRASDLDRWIRSSLSLLSEQKHDDDYDDGLDGLLRSVPALADGLIRGSPHQSILTPSRGFFTGLEYASEYFAETKQSGDSSVAILCTISDQTFLCLHQKKRWYLLDATTSAQDVCLYRFDTLRSLSRHLLEIFRSSKKNDDDDDDDDELYTAYQTHSMILDEAFFASKRNSKNVLLSVIPEEANGNKESANRQRSAPSGFNEDAYVKALLAGSQTKGHDDALVKKKKKSRGHGEAEEGASASHSKRSSRSHHRDERSRSKHDETTSSKRSSKPPPAGGSHHDESSKKSGKRPRKLRSNKDEKKERKHDGTKSSSSSATSSSSVRRSRKDPPVASRGVAVEAPKQPPNTTDQDEKKPSAAQATAKAVPAISPLIDKRDYVDPITFEVMADPVNCDDGYTYERTVMERYMEERQLEASKQQQHGNNSGANSCGREKPPIQLTSPMTGEVMEGRLFPNRSLENQIVRLVENNALGMSDEELEDWHERRQQKKIRDQRRQQLLQHRRQQQEEEEEEEPPLEPSRRVRLDRNTRVKGEKLCDDDLGLSVMLCDDGERISPEYVMNAGDRSGVRCMVACCAIDLGKNKHQWCSRCGRLACSECLGFVVTDIEEGTSPMTPHRICSDCVSQVVDVIDPQDTRLQQEKNILQDVTLERHLAFLANRAAKAQDQVVQFETTDRYQPRVEQLMADIRSLKEERSDLACRIEESNEALQQALNFRKICNGLRNELILLQQDNDRVSSNDIEQYHTGVAVLQSQHEEAALNLAMTISKIMGSSSLPYGKFDDKQILELEAKSERLEARRQILISSRLEERHTDAEANRVQEISALDAELEETHYQLAIVHSNWRTGNAADAAGGPPPRVPPVCMEATNRFLQELKEYRPTTMSSASSVSSLTSTDSYMSSRSRSRNNGRSKHRNKNNDDVRRLLRSLTSRRDKINRLLDKTNASQQPSNDIQRVANEMLRKLKESDSRIQAIFHEEIEAAMQELTAAAERQAVPVDNSKRQQLRVEYEMLNSVDVTTLSEDEQVTHMVRWSELEVLVGAMDDEQQELQKLRAEETDKVVECRAHLAAIGVRRCPNWPLPLGLQYPTPRVKEQLRVVENTLLLRLVASQRSWEDQYRRVQDELIRERDSLEDEIACEQTELLDIQARVDPDKAEERREERRAEEEERHKRRERRRRWEESVRHQSDDSLLEYERKAHGEKTTLLQQHAQSSKRPAGDLRMCRVCRTGPIENSACPDLQVHNNASTNYQGKKVASVRNPNRCPNCDWFHPNWNQWPYWDGIYGPH